MDVLNTTGGGVDTIGILCGMLLLTMAVFGTIWTISTYKDGSHGFCIVFSILTLASALIGTAMIIAETPIRHEVTLRPGYVIDAEKYEIVEQRGKIYVIEEREAAE